MKSFQKALIGWKKASHYSKLLLQNFSARTSRVNIRFIISSSAKVAIVK